MLIRTLHRLFLLGLITASGIAQPVPKLNSLSREWVQRGKKTEVKAFGENLAAITNVAIAGSPGVGGNAVVVLNSSSQMDIESSDGGIKSVRRSEAKEITLSLDIAENAALTDHELRVMSADGVSNPLIFHVSPYPEVGSAKNESRESAQKIEMPAAINGTIQNAAESDFFRVTAKKDQHVIAEVYAARIGSKLDSSLAVYDKSGKELGRNEDAVGLDSVLNFKVPEDGDYIFELRDFRFQGGGDYRYRLVLGVLPHVQRAFPFGGQRGQTVDLTLEGSNLDAKKLTLSLAPDAALGSQQIRASSHAGLSNPFSFEVSDLPDMSETEPNAALDQADRIPIPVAINGRIGAKKDSDAFRFRAAADQRIIFEVNAARHGSRLDAILVLRDGTGKVLQRNDDAAGEDARIDYTFKEAGEYFIVLEDLLGRGGDQYGYRLTAQLPQPDFSVTLVGDTPRIHRGGHVPVRCEVNRMNGFNEPVLVTCEDLPSGVYAEPLLLRADMSAGHLLLTAENEASRGSFPLKIAARAQIGGRSVMHPAEVLSNDKSAMQAFLTVLNPAPFSVLPATLMANLEQNQSGDIELMVDRHQGYNGEIKIAPEGFSAGRDPISKSFDLQPLTLKSGESHGKVSLKTKTDSEIGTRRIFLRAEGDAGIVDYSSFIPLATTQIPFVLSTSLRKFIVTALPTNSASAASEAVFNAKVERRGGFEGELELKLEGVPEGVIATVTNIAAKANESALKLVATDKAPTGTNFQLTLTGIGQHKDRTYRFQAPPITLTINASESEEKKEPKLANKQ